MRKHALIWAMALAAAVQMLSAVPAAAQQKKPNILVIWGDDIGQFNISAYNQHHDYHNTSNTISSQQPDSNGHIPKPDKSELDR